jgi:hypothetical protein
MSHQHGHNRHKRRRYPAHGATVVGPGGSIQAAVHAADLGNTIRMFGTHRETSGTATVISRTRGSLLLSCMQASVGESRRGTPAPDDRREPRSKLRRRLVRQGGAGAPARSR